jgi:hypothetical protein
MTVRQRASRSCRAVGSSKEPSPGSTVAAGSPKTSRPRSQARLPGSSSPTFAASPDGSQGLESNQVFMSQTLRAKLLKLDPDTRAEALVRLCLLWGASGKYSGTADDFTRVMESLQDDFASVIAPALLVASSFRPRLFRDHTSIDEKGVTPPKSPCQRPSPPGNEATPRATVLAASPPCQIRPTFADCDSVGQLFEVIRRHHAVPVCRSDHRTPDQSAEIAHWSDYQSIRRRPSANLNSRDSSITGDIFAPLRGSRPTAALRPYAWCLASRRRRTSSLRRWKSRHFKSSNCLV